MPFDEWYDDATREAATARVLQRRMTNPTDRNVLTVVAEEFSVPRQTLSDWVDEASPETATPARKSRPKFSQVVKTTKEARVESPTDDDPAEAPQSAAPPEPASDPEPEPTSGPEPEPEPAPESEPEPEPEPQPGPASGAVPEAAPEPAPAPPAPAGTRVGALEAEVAALRHGNGALIQAMRVLLDV